eukprot:Rmarinus@m.6421
MRALDSHRNRTSAHTPAHSPPCPLGSAGGRCRLAWGVAGASAVLPPHAPRTAPCRAQPRDQPSLTRVKCSRASITCPCPAPQSRFLLQTQARSQKTAPPPPSDRMLRKRAARKILPKYRRARLAWSTSSPSTSGMNSSHEKQLRQSMRSECCLLRRGRKLSSNARS